MWGLISGFANGWGSFSGFTAATPIAANAVTYLGEPVTYSGVLVTYG